MTIRTKLFRGFGTMIVAMFGLGGLAYYVCVTGSHSAEQLSEMTTDVSIGSDLLEDLLMCRMNVKDYLITNMERDIDQYDSYRRRIQTTLRSCEENCNRSQDIGTALNREIFYCPGWPVMNRLSRSCGSSLRRRLRS